MKAAVVIVTGGGRGIGRAVCERFAAAGAQTVAVARNTEELGQTKRSIEQKGGLCHVQPADVASGPDVATLIDVVRTKFGRIDVAVNCAGVAPMAGIEELDASVFEAILAVNVRAVYHVCREVWPVMMVQGGGVIVNVSSIAAVDPFGGFEAYGASKAWVNAWTKSLAAAGRPHGIRVVGVAPGAVETSMLRNAFPDFPAEQTLAPADVAETIHAVAQEPFRYATGEVVYIRKGP